MKPCPFCASTDTEIDKRAVTRFLGNFDHYEYFVTCLNCGATGPNDLGESGAIEMWDMRRLQTEAETALAFTNRQLTIERQRTADCATVVLELEEARK